MKTNGKFVFFCIYFHFVLAIYQSDLFNDTSLGLLFSDRSINCISEVSVNRKWLLHYNEE